MFVFALFFHLIHSTILARILCIFRCMYWSIFVHSCRVHFELTWAWHLQYRRRHGACATSSGWLSSRRTAVCRRGSRIVCRLAYGWTPWRVGAGQTWTGVPDTTPVIAPPHRSSPSSRGPQCIYSVWRAGEPTGQLFFLLCPTRGG